MFCKAKKNFITNAKNIIEVSTKRKLHIDKENHIDKNELLIIGTHIADTNNSLNFPSLSKELIKLNLPYNRMEIFYLPHPKAGKMVMSK